MADNGARSGGDRVRRERAFRQIARQIEPQGVLRSTSALTGGVSARVTVVEIARADGQSTKLIVREHGEADRARNANIARDEFRLLELAHGHGLMVPEPYFHDASGALLPTPFLVLAYVDGDTGLAPTDRRGYLEQAAATLAKIHTVRETAELAFLRRVGNGYPAPSGDLDASLDEARIRDALASTGPLSRMNNPALLHGDYWPGNLLWRDGALAAVIDWEDAHVGDPLADLANSRLEFLWAFGRDAMDAFTDTYRSRVRLDFTDLPYWDLCAALRPCSKLSGWGLDAPTERRMRERHHQFVSRAIAALARR